MRALHSRCDDWVALCRVAADDEDQIGLLDIGDRARIAAITHGAEQAHGRGRLAVAGTIVHVVGTDEDSRQFLQEVALFVRTLR